MTEVTEQMRNYSTLSAAIVLVVLSACASGRNVEGILSGAGGGCVTCHGGMDNDLTGAPPLDAHGLTTSAAVGAHRAHLGIGVVCASCHRDVNLTSPLFAGHRNGTSDVVFGAVAFDPAGGTTPAYDATSHGCSNVYCHAPSTAPGGTRPAPLLWDAPVGSISGCGVCHAATPANHSGIGGRACRECHATTFEPGSATSLSGPGTGGTHADGTISLRAHDPGWATTSANGVTPHGLAALYRSTASYPTGLAGCRGCHGSNLNNPIVAGAGIKSCDACHQAYALPGTAGTDWRTDCTFCHGDRARLAAGLDVAGVTTLAFAPPRDTAGQVTSAEVGAHTAHLSSPSGTSGGVACGACHGLVNDLVHVNGSTAVSLKDPLGAGSGTYNATTQTCAASYCHGNFTGGKTGNTPSWTGAGSQTCTSCHDGSPRTGHHPSVFDKHAPQNQNCTYCHFRVANMVDGNTAGTFSTIKSTGRALHVNGSVNVSLSSNGINVRPTGGAFVDGWDSATKSCSPGCHGTQSW
jgi:predicted CxxxxCH...CXXCH cytochrome family protein